MNEIDTAISTLENGSGYNPTDASYFILLSDLYRFKKQNSAAIEALEKAKKLSPDNQEVITKLNELKN